MENKKTIYEFGAMSNRYSLEAENKLTAYATMCAFYDRSAHLIAIYEPLENKSDQWMCFDGQISERLDKIFGGSGSFDKYFENNISEIRGCYETIKKLV